uniref:Late embryogenesis abundant protein LEA-2 subgroup domain-containing protein n=1 Tax=Cajanus cajan TaxID=3821 RepID=A0A151R535_CAJCA|nr:hypothetical protein KK1_041174 [Cajanus cajan]
MFPSRKQEKQSSKCLVYTLASFVTLFFVWFVFASIVLRVQDPDIELKSARLSRHNTDHHHYNHSFDVTMIARVTLTNPNFGPFYNGDSRVSVLYGASTVGASQLLEGATVEPRQTKEFNFKLHMRFTKSANANLTNDITSGMLKLTSYAKLSGTVHVLNIVNKKKTILMACIINLNITSYSIHHFQC